MLILEPQSMGDAPQIMPSSAHLSPRERIVAGTSLLVTVLFLLAPTSFPLGKLDMVAYAVCHRIPERSLFFGGHQLPLCARCSGTFLGVLLTWIVLTLSGRSQTGRLAPRRVLIVLVGFVVVWAVDGLNSYLTLYPGAPHLYEPQNWLRLTTGMLNGLALGTWSFAMFHFSIWRGLRDKPALQGLSDLVKLGALAALMVGLMLTGEPWLLYPLALASTLGVLVMLTSINTVVLAVATGKENSASAWRDAALLLVAALALSLIIVMAIGGMRAVLTEALQLPF
jgi:uncharacterized membrane protein